MVHGCWLVSVMEKINEKNPSRTKAAEKLCGHCCALVSTFRQAGNGEGLMDVIKCITVMSIHANSSNKIRKKAKAVMLTPLSMRCARVDGWCSVIYHHFTWEWMNNELLYWGPFICCLILINHSVSYELLKWPIKAQEMRQLHSPAEQWGWKIKHSATC